MAPFTPKAPLEKLPLATRKDIRDNYESVKPELLKQIEDLRVTGIPYTIDINVNEVFAYATESYSKDRPGKMFKECGVHEFLPLSGPIANQLLSQIRRKPHLPPQNPKGGLRRHRHHPLQRSRLQR